MIRENKYLVLKNADIEKHLSDEHQLKLDLFTTKIRIGRLNDGKQDQQYVVVAADWPMYETVWQMVEAFVDGKPNELEISQAENAELKERVVTLEKLQGVALIESLRAEVESLTRQRDLAVSELETVATGFDCDNDAHKYGTYCRKCEATKALAAIKSQNQTTDKSVDKSLADSDGV